MQRDNSTEEYDIAFAVNAENVTGFAPLTEPQKQDIVNAARSIISRTEVQPDDCPRG